MSLERALEVAAAAGGRAYPKPTVGAVLVRDGEVVGEGATEEGRTGRHGEIVALEAAGERARGATLYVTMEPCAHHGSTPPCSEAIVRARRGARRRRLARSEPRGGGRLRAAARRGVEVELEDSFAARRLSEGWRRWVTAGRPFVTYKAAISLDGRVTVPGERWVTGEASPPLGCTSCAPRVDAVAVGMGTVRADEPRLDARDVPVVRQPRRLAFGRGPLPAGSELELRAGPLEDELRKLAADGVQTLLLEGGPTLATAFLRASLVDKLLLFVAPVLSGGGPDFLGLFEGPIRPLHVEWSSVGDDILVEAYLREP